MQNQMNTNDQRDYLTNQIRIAEENAAAWIEAANRERVRTGGLASVAQEMQERADSWKRVYAERRKRLEELPS
jgi:hypothetical protein